MRCFSSALLVITVALSAACSTPAVTPTVAPESPAAATSFPPSPTETPPSEDVVSATPLTPGQEPLNPWAQPFAPQPGDERLTRGNIYVDSTEIIVAESFPPQFFLHVTGSLPDPCHQLRASVSVPDSQSHVVVAVYSLADPTTACIAVLQPLDVSVPLGSLPAGKFEVWVNGQPAGEIQSP